MTAPFLKAASAGVGPLFSGSLLYIGAAAGAGLMAAFRSQERGPAPTTRRAVGRLVAMAIVGAAVAPTLLVVGLRRTDAATASLLLALEAPFTVVFARLFLREFIGRRVMSAALLVLAGGAILVSGSLGSPSAVSGTLLVVAAALAWALDNLLSRPLADLDPVKVVAFKGLLGGVASALVGVMAGEAAPPAARAIQLLVLGAVGYGLSLQLYLRAQRVVGAARTASVFASAPFVGVVVAFASGAPWPGLQLPVAAALVGLGLWLHLSERHAHRHEHQSLEHEHLHRHDDAHHGHSHEEMPTHPHSHRHRHEPVTHEHEHSEDVHHLHAHPGEPPPR
jgi:drug/metabolite transporter (DMT)-like permease